MNYSVMYQTSDKLITDMKLLIETLIVYLHLWIGEIKMLSQMSRTKAHVVPAGPSQQPALLKESMQLTVETLFLSQNSS